jgi:hypothetical protein
MKMAAVSRLTDFSFNWYSRCSDLLELHTVCHDLGKVFGKLGVHFSNEFIYIN